MQMARVDLYAATCEELCMKQLEAPEAGGRIIFTGSTDSS